MQNSYTGEADNVRRLKRLLILTGFIALLLIIFYWVYSHAFISITIDAADPRLSYVLVDQNSGKTTKFNGTGRTVKRLVQKGNYELSAEQGKVSFFAVLKTGGFLSTSSVHGLLTAERSRKFIGDNPAPCMYYSGLLLSYNCNDLLSSAWVHEPATATQPTTAQHDLTGSDATIEGITTTQQGSFMLVQAPLDNGGAHVIYPISADLKLGAGTVLGAPQSGQTYAIVAYKDGFIVYNKSLDQILYYPSLTTATPISISLNRTPDSTFSAYAQSIKGDTIIVAYTNLEDSQNTNAKQVKSLTRIAVNQNNNLKQFTFNRQYGAVSACGNNKLCLLADKKLEVYDISNTKQKLLYVLNNVASMQASGNKLLIVRDKEILDFDVESQNGYVSYRINNYTACGLQPDANGYALCLINANQSKIALYIDQRSADSDSIDQKAAELLKLPEIKALSVYGNYIFVSPNLGAVDYQPSLGSFGYDPTITKSVNSKINQTINAAGIDRNTYKVVNPFDN